MYEDDTVGWGNTEGRHASPPYGDPPTGQTQNHHYRGGRGVEPFSFGDHAVGQTARYYNPFQQRALGWKIFGGLHSEAISSTSREILVENPFFIHETQTDNEADKTPGETFVHLFEAWANSKDVASLSIIPPDRPIADIAVNGFASEAPWVWMRAPGAAFQLRTDSANSVGVGMSGSDTSHHPGETITYETWFLLTARGRNHVEFETAGSRGGQLTNRVYEWETVFRRASEARELLPIQYKVTSTEPPYEYVHDDDDSSWMDPDTDEESAWMDDPNAGDESTSTDPNDDDPGTVSDLSDDELDELLSPDDKEEPDAGSDSDDDSSAGRNDETDAGTGDGNANSDAEEGNPATGAAQCTMMATVIDLGSFGIPGRYDAHRFQVHVVDQDGTALAEAQVSVHNPKSDDTMTDASGTTNAGGNITFEPRTVYPGENTFAITGVTHPTCILAQDSGDILRTWMARKRNLQTKS